MYQQLLADNVHFLHASKMSEVMMRLQQQSAECQAPSSSGERVGRSADNEPLNYEHSMLNFAAAAHQNDGSSAAAFVVIPRTEYDFMKQEIATLKHTMTEFKSMVNFEIQQLKQDSKVLKQQVDTTACSRPANSNAGTVSVTNKKTNWSGNNGENF